MLLGKRFVPTLGIVLLTGITLVTSVAGVMKVSNSISSVKPNVVEVKEISPTLTPTPTTIQANLTVTTTLTPTLTVVPSCIVTLFGKQYNVISLQQTHSGGNIFNCGTDMTSVYQAQHGTDVSKMSKYLVTGNSGNTTAVSSNNGDDEENEKEESDDREQMEKDIQKIKDQKTKEHKDI